MNTENMIEVTGIDLVFFVKKVYEMSQPLGWGHFQATSELLSTECAVQIVDKFKNDKRYAVNMDYISGRSCKMHVYQDEDKLWISNHWYDHTNKQLKELLTICNKH